MGICFIVGELVLSDNLWVLHGVQGSGKMSSHVDQEEALKVCILRPGGTRRAECPAPARVLENK